MTTAGDFNSDAPDPARIRNVIRAADYRPPDDIEFRVSEFWSENVRLKAQWFRLKANAGRKLPLILTAHGWGGTAAHFRKDAIDVARAGYCVMLFDYRGWGESDGRLVAPRASVIDAPNSQPAGYAQQLREYIDPFEQVEDWFNAFSYAVCDPLIDESRVGIRGSSFSGGHVVYVAAHEPRVRALVSQVGSFDSRYRASQQQRAAANDYASRLACGVGSYPEAGATAIGQLVGTPVGNKLQRWAPVEFADRVTQPTLVVLAEKEELFSNQTNGLAAYDKLAGEKDLLVIPDATHYAVYGPARDIAVGAAIAWFDRHLT